MTGLIFVGMVGPDSHNKEEQRFVEELSQAFAATYYLRGAGVKGLRWHQIASLPSRLAKGRAASGHGKVHQGSIAIIPLRKFARTANTRWIGRQLTKITGTAPVEWTLWIRFPSPELVAAIATLPNLKVVYEPIDLYAAAEDLSATESSALLEAETKLIRHATVVTGGRLLAERFHDAVGGSQWLPFGIDREQPPRGAGLTKASKPRLAVVGCLDWRVDETLLVSVMRDRPDWELVLAGPRVRPWGERLGRLENVTWLGRIPVDRVRSVIRECDVTLIPYRLTDWTRHCLPVKVFEYLAEGKPVVATQLPELKLLADVVTIAPGGVFAEAINTALIGDSQQDQDRRRQAAVRFTLQDRARRAIELIQGKELQAATL